MQRGWGNGPRQLRQRRPRVEAVRVAVQVDMTDHGHRRAHRLHETGALAVRHRVAGDPAGARRPQALTARRLRTDGQTAGHTAGKYGAFLGNLLRLARLAAITPAGITRGPTR